MSKGPEAVRRVAIVANPNVGKEYSERLVKILDEGGVEVERLTEPTGTREDEGLDLVFVLGGDGTMLRASRMYPGQILVGVNLGTLGFMSGMRPEELESGVKKGLKGGIHVQEYRMLEVRVAGEEEAVRTAVNDAALVKRVPHHITTVEVAVGGEELVTLRCDGFVAATPLGSTAYALSAGGPIVAGDVECYVLVPIAPHSLLTRPLILGQDQVAELRVKEPGALLSVDGDEPEEIPDGGCVRFGLSHESVKIGRTDEWNWWRAVRKTFL
ncbi:MAG TPA: NAD(+)/NADH kinase [Rubrobacteraceae bacterium]|nr:NAD(+)/NADH kinase [Rubrobacteraceae bacterium]